MQVLPQFENLFSANGYLGYSTTYFNAPEVFNYAVDFTGNTLPSGWTGSGSYYLSNGELIINGTTGSTSVTSSSSYNPSIETLMFSGYFNETGNPSGIPVFYVAWSSSTLVRITAYSGAYYLQNYNGTLNAVALTGGSNNQFNLFQIEELSTASYASINNGLYTENSVDYSEQTSAQISLQYAGGTSSQQGFFQYVILRTVVTMPTFSIGTFTNMTDHAVASYLSNSITIPMPNWFNLTLKAYTNYSYCFQLLVWLFHWYSL